MTEIRAGQKGMKIEITIKDDAGAAINLTGATVVYQILSPSGARSDKNASIDNAATGLTSYTTAATSEFTELGEHRISPKITFPDTKILYASPVVFNVVAKFHQ